MIYRNNEKLNFATLLSISSLFLFSCGGSGGSSTSPPTAPPAPTPPPVTPPETGISDTDQLIKVNQVGFYPSSQKLAIVPENGATEFTILNNQGEQVLQGVLSDEATWNMDGRPMRIADFSELNTSGTYTVQVEGVSPSHPFQIGDDIFENVHDAVLKAYYFNRASTALEQSYAGDWQRPSAHPDTNVLVHRSAASAERPEGFSISSPKGWYDAGDYNKYIVNSGISTYTLLAAYENFSAFYDSRSLNIPESGNALPDIIDEILWNVSWMQTMQDPNDGGVYHKLTALNFEGALMPHEATAQRYVVQKGTSAALNFAAVSAQASRIFSSIESLKSMSAELRAASLSAWQWAKSNPDVPYIQPSDVFTGQYGDSDFSDEFAWAAAELFLLTQDTAFLDEFIALDVPATTPSWPQVGSLGLLSLLNQGQSLLSQSQYNDIKAKVIAFADQVVSDQDNAYSVGMTQNDLIWGSNASGLNKAIMLLHAAQYADTDSTAYINAAQSFVDYVLGRNPTDYSYVTGVGSFSPMDPHHRQSFADSIAAPVPGFVVGGAQPGQQDGCNYPSNEPARSYLDDWCSYSTNEVTINWNAPMVYVLAALENQ
ncbi:glycoside hydrolase family 9 protein [Ningiella sp. W23]|uniref:glycoside hydrolase family 9 protein n=1 Tax=Ningiella sp. W23 TaxID=3023715 RepID=UPI00375767BD